MFFPPPPQLPAPEGRWGKVATIASTSEVCYYIFCWNVHHFRYDRKCASFSPLTCRRWLCAHEPSSPNEFGNACRRVSGGCDGAIRIT
ncbi:BZ3500_MvSof-1268-A1-R1_Chr3-1g06026 [Microbotryum saponariae]|uniref:BZ3500_MvSof-1268-A1-R1_Chr3-1g06026 protein n=1 Tax=Microbotryum saponariae TaxID=289078 RepID=A0A2X0KZ35_9BASI|nr:BZ3500_MvSof-1268-A1-R1_Chr3-1g06026 [Microbotryum saponariae]SCZ99869.1 BZ3501_MvSof-1269-A2-R1_Chr12-2g03538 [Microbotryum saponariae]SDA03825.1 BZ3501_MvSof-1269-A2-R1_Chr3-2g05711 [Microbotryum saponariae]SDA05216.1 BZ3501_MvSof-1269-A2-R1_Chr3-1g05696 [Microbotryum saponariae]